MSGLFKTEGLLNVLGSRIRCKSGNISEMVLDRDVVIMTTNRIHAAVVKSI